MNMRFTFTRESIKRKRSGLLYGILMLFFSVLLLMPYAANAQPVPVDIEFQGEWVFSRAEAKERGHVRQINSAVDFYQNDYFREIPVRIIFTADFPANITTGFWEDKAVFAATMPDYGLDFRETEALEEFKQDKPGDLKPEIDKYPVIMPVYTSIKKEGDNTMSLQSTYSYYDASRRYIEGVITTYYERR